MRTQWHFIGIGGIGMSGLARILLSRNYKVSGSDLVASPVTEGLVKAGAKVYIGHEANNVSAEASVVYSTDIKKDNPEYRQATTLHCPLLHRSDLLFQLMEGYRPLAVTGTHGKTTTSALLASVLAEGREPSSFAVGGILPQFGSNAEQGNGGYFVAEADESDGTFLKYHPYGAIITNIDLDHMDYYGSEGALIRAFHSFASRVLSPELLFWCGDDPRLCGLNLPGIKYGFSEDCALRVENFFQKEWKIVFDMVFMGKRYQEIEVALVGHHNALNSAAVFGMALLLGIEEEVIRKVLRSFQGVKRRCEIKGESQGVLFLDDYAHHPTEILTTLQGIRCVIGERRLVVVFQPHRYSRTRDCLGTYGEIFKDVDALFITDIYGAGEAEIPGITHEPVLAEIKKNLKAPCCYVPRAELTQKLSDFIRPHDVVVTLGAGDVTKLGAELITYFKKQPVKKLTVGVIFGGRSQEHEISLLSVRNILASLKQDYYEVLPFAIMKEGEWISGEKATSYLKKESVESDSPVMISREIIDQLLKCDLLFPVLHGPFGEDGTIQGLFEILGKAYAGCDHRSSAICMDKALTKTVMMHHGIATLPFIGFAHREWKTNSHKILKEIELELKFPVFVKPAHLGSSVGVQKVETKDQLKETIENAFQLDDFVIVENGVIAREIEFAVFGNDHIQVFPPGEICSHRKIYNYESKYGENSMAILAKAPLPEKLLKQGMELAKKAYLVTGCNGFARVDFFLDEEENFWLNEINPIPGFTNTSLYPKICEENGLKTNDLIDQFIILGLHRKRAQQQYI